MNEDRVVLEAALTAQREGHAAALAIVVETQGSVPRQPGSKMLVWQDGRIVGTVGGGQMEALVIAEAQQALRDGQCRMFTYNLADLEAGDPGVCGGTMKIYVEPLLPPPTVLVIGCGHVGKAVAELAKWLGYRVIAADDRPGYATPEQLPGMDGYVEAAPHELAAKVAITAFTYVVAVTRGLNVDETLLPALLKTPAPYIGLIGSRRRWTLTVQVLREQGISPEDLARVHAPVGLSIGAETPKEIAVSILAEIIQVQRGGSGESLRWSPPVERVVQSGQ
ncbi:MAG: XdhC family protein [Aggregatilineaceae bacterium]